MKHFLNYIDQKISLTENEKIHLEKICSSKIFGKNEYFSIQGKICRRIAFVRSGIFRFYYTTDNGEEANTEFIIDSGFLTDFISYSQNIESKFTIQALEKSEVTILNLREINDKDLFDKIKRIGSKYIDTYCLNNLLNHQIMLSECPDKRYDLLKKYFPNFLQRIPKKHIASFMRIRPETLSRIKKRALDLNQAII
jgi:hypothetical protein